MNYPLILFSVIQNMNEYIWKMIYDYSQVKRYTWNVVVKNWNILRIMSMGGGEYPGFVHNYNEEHEIHRNNFHRIRVEN